MKVILFTVSLFFSISATAATIPNEFIEQQGIPWDASYYGGIAGGSINCFATSCFGGQYTASSYFEIYDGVNLPENNANYFYITSDRPPEAGFLFYEGIFRTFVAGNQYRALKDFDFTVTYSSFGVESLRIYAGSIFDLTETSGSFTSSAQAGKPFDLGLIGLLSDASYADNAFFTLEITFLPAEVGEVPLPASIFFLAPALLGFMAFRRKTKSS